MVSIVEQIIMKAILFDLDGTLVDNMMIHHEAWQRKLSSLGLELTLEEVKNTIHGVNEEIVARLFGDQFDAAERQRIAGDKEQEYRDIFAKRLKPIDGLMDFLNQLRAAGTPMAVGTAAPPDNVNFVLDNLGIRSYFHSVLHSGDVKHGKPDPEVFLKSAHNLGVSPKDCVVFEDSVIGAETALNAGCQSVIVTTTHAEQEFNKFSNIIRFIDDYQGLTIDNLK